MAMKTFPLEMVKTHLDYDRERGLLLRRSSRGRGKRGEVAGNLNVFGYRMISINGSRVLAHRLVWALETGEWPQQPIDHKNLNRDDNRFSNLRLCTAELNQGNTRARSASGYKGVTKTPAGTFQAFIGDRGRVRSLGVFTDPSNAHAAYCAAATAKYGEFARFA